MKSNVFFQTEDNSYFLNKSSGNASIVHNLMAEMFRYEEEHKKLDKSFFYETYPKEEVDYYYAKYVFWKKNNLISSAENTQHKLEHKITPSDVEHSLINTTQLTFEVTEQCNIDCSYCAYGDLYNSYDKRYNKTLTLESVQRFLDYFVELRNSKTNFNFKKELYISFYGGEPLMNMSFIKDVVEYFKKTNIRIKFSMTTNGLLLKKNIDFLVENSFNLLISLDGNEKHNAYRKLKNDKNSFSLVFDNVKFIQLNHPAFFDDNVRFNSVITNLSDEEEMTAFFQKEFNKPTTFSALNPSGIEESKVDEFFKMFKKMTLPKKIEPKAENPIFVQVAKFLRTQVKPQLDSFIVPTQEDEISMKPTGTCLPFSKRVFITSQGHIFACEKIDHKYKLGFVNEDTLNLNLDFVSKEYEFIFEKAIEHCKYCYRQANCPKCLLYTDTVDQECDIFLGLEAHVKELYYYFSVIENTPEIVTDSFEKLIID